MFSEESKSEEKEKEEEKETEKLFAEKERKGLLAGLDAAGVFALVAKGATTSSALHHGPASKRRLAAIRKGHRTKIQTTFHEGEWRSTVWIQEKDQYLNPDGEDDHGREGWDYVAVWRNGKAEYAYRITRAGGHAAPIPIGFAELP